jgi:hypothetical protein
MTSVVPYDPSPKKDQTDPLAELTQITLGIYDDHDSLADRVLYLEAAVWHLAELVGLNLPGLPDPFTRTRQPEPAGGVA